MKEVLSLKQKKLLEEFLDLAEDKENTFTLPALEGFFFGIAITPTLIKPSEWMPIIFDGPIPLFKSDRQANLLLSNLFDSYNSYLSAFYNDELSFPYEIENPTKELLYELEEWCAGFIEALSLNLEIWHIDTKDENLQEEPNYEVQSVQLAFTIIYSFVDPEILQHYSTEEMEGIESKEEIYLTIYNSLPAAVETLKNYGLKVARKKFK